MLELLKCIGEWIIGGIVCLFLLFFVFADFLYEYCKKVVDINPEDSKNELSEWIKTYSFR